MSLFFRKKPIEIQPSLYDEYKDSRDEAWRVLAEHMICELPVDLRFLCDGEQIELYSFTQAQVLIQSLHLQNECNAENGIALQPDGRRIILYDDALPVEMRRFVIACAFGHFVLGHTEKYAKSAALPFCFSTDEELQAGIFAGRLLAPLSVLWAMGVQSAEEIRKICIVPKQTAEKRFARLCEIDERNLDRGIKTGQGTLFLSGYERSAYRNFSAFTETYRQTHKK